MQTRPLSQQPARDEKRLYQQERAILEVTELLSKWMKKQNVSRAELAKRLGKTKGYITQLLDGATNMTLRTISDVLYVMDASLHVSAGKLSVRAREPKLEGRDDVGRRRAGLTVRPVGASKA